MTLTYRGDLGEILETGTGRCLHYYTHTDGPHGRDGSRFLEIVCDHCLDVVDRRDWPSGPAPYRPGMRVQFQPSFGDDRHGTVSTRHIKAWTPDELTATAPDAGMVVVIWDDADGLTGPLARPYKAWEYTRDLLPAPHRAVVSQ